MGQPDRSGHDDDVRSLTLTTEASARQPAGNIVAAVGAPAYAGDSPFSKGAPPVTLRSAIKREDTHARVYSPFMAVLSRKGQAIPREAAG